MSYLLIAIATIYHAIATFAESKTAKPPGDLIDIGGYQLHLYTKGKGSPKVIIDHSLGGIEGYFLIEEIAKFTQVCIYDRPGYGWSDFSPKRRCSEEIVRELDLLLIKAKIEPPYILVGNSFGSYNVRLYAHHFPKLSDRYIHISANKSSHFVWIDEPEIIIEAVKKIYSNFI